MQTFQFKEAKPVWAKGKAQEMNVSLQLRAVVPQTAAVLHIACFFFRETHCYILQSSRVSVTLRELLDKPLPVCGIQDERKFRVWIRSEMRYPHAILLATVDFLGLLVLDSLNNDSFDVLALWQAFHTAVG